MPLDFTSLPRLRRIRPSRPERFPSGLWNVSPRFDIAFVENDDKSVREGYLPFVHRQVQHGLSS